MRLRDLEIFQAVMQCGSVKAAAVHLHITQPAASRLLQQAEQHAGLQLFRRERGRLVPTREALALHAETDRLFLQLEGVKRLLGNLRRGTEAQLRVWCVPSLGEPWLTQAVAELQRRHPQLRVSLRSAYSPQITQGLALRDADVGFAFAAESHPAVAGSVIAEGEMVCVGALRGASVTLEALAHQPVIELDPADPIGRLLMRACEVQGVQLQGTALAHNYHTAVALARRGLGVALVDSFTGRRAAADGGASMPLRCVPLRPSLPVLVHALRPQGAAGSAMVDGLVQTMARLLNHG